MLTIFIIKTELLICRTNIYIAFPGQNRPCTSPVSRSKSISQKQGLDKQLFSKSSKYVVTGCYLVDSPGMVDMVPTRGYKNPAPTDALTSLMGMTKPVGAPFLLGSEERER